MKGIILAGGAGTRLHPLTSIITKQLLPVYDKPMIYYPMSTLVSGGIRDILIISDGSNIDKFIKLFKNGSHLGLNIEYAIQKEPRGIAEAFIIGESFINNDSVTLILGDNIFHSSIISESLQKNKEHVYGAINFVYPVRDPERYGIVELDDCGEIVSIVEKPQNPKSNLAVVGLYVYDFEVVNIAKDLTPSKRNELEITDINNFYLDRKKLQVVKLGRGCAWLDAGTFASLQQSSNYIQTIQDRQGNMIGSIEEVVWRAGYINDEQLDILSRQFKSEYGRYLQMLINY